MEGHGSTIITSYFHVARAKFRKYMKKGNPIRLKWALAHSFWLLELSKTKNTYAHRVRPTEHVPNRS